MWPPFFGQDGGDGGFGGGGGVGTTASSPMATAAAAASSRRRRSGGGGGGAGLGGAIFNDGGSVDIRNSTFIGNVTGGGFSEKAQDGITGGGAIFSRNGHLTVLNTTDQRQSGAHRRRHSSSPRIPRALRRRSCCENSIVANNGRDGMRDHRIQHRRGLRRQSDPEQSPTAREFHGETFIGCQGVVTTSDPQLGPLQYNQGATPTMAIGSTSPAWNAADPATSLPVDQRKQPRPAMGGFDIGAFELCLEGFGKLQQPCLILAGH